MHVHYEENPQFIAGFLRDCLVTPPGACGAAWVVLVEGLDGSREVVACVLIVGVTSTRAGCVSVAGVSQGSTRSRISWKG